MKYEVEKQKGQANFTFNVPKEEWENEVTAVYNKTKGKYNIPGFRKGKVPKKVIETHYGQGVFFDDAFNSVANKSYSKALTENEDVFPVDEPKVDIKEFGDSESGDLVFTMTVTTKPEVILGKYKDETIKRAEYPTTDKEIDKEIETLRERAGRLVKIEDRAIINGDSINLNYSGSVDGVKFDGGTAEKQTLVIGSNSFIPGFEEQMIGMKIGETKDLNVKFPDDYHSEELKGKNAVFNVTVNEISHKELPALDDNFAKDTSKFETYNEFKDDLVKRLTEQNNLKADNENKNALIEKIVENATVDIPECMINEELEYMLKDFEYRLMYMYQGMKLDDYLNYTGSSREGFKTERKADAAKSVKTRLVLQEIIKIEKLEVTDSELDEQIKKIAENAGKTLDEYKNTLKPQQLSQIKNDVLVTKTLDLLVAQNNFVKGEAKPKVAAKKTAEVKKDESDSGESAKKTTQNQKSTAKSKN